MIHYCTAQKSSAQPPVSRVPLSCSMATDLFTIFNCCVGNICVRDNSKGMARRVFHGAPSTIKINSPMKNVAFFDLLELLPPRQILHALAMEKRFEYLVAFPFRHVVLDNFLPADVAETVHSSFPSGSHYSWKQYQNDKEKKLEMCHEERLPVPIRNLLYALNTGYFLRFLEALTFVKGIMPDPDFEGGGMHQILPGGRLAVHVDFNFHHRFRLLRRLNLLFYLNKQWQEEYGGYLELWSHSENRCIKTIAPIFNRCVIFSTSEESFHGHPAPLRCPEDVSRKSLALYYYSTPADKQIDKKAHSTIWMEDCDKVLTK